MAQFRLLGSKVGSREAYMAASCRRKQRQVAHRKILNSIPRFDLQKRCGETVLCLVSGIECVNLQKTRSV